MIDQSIQIQLPERAYPVYIGRGLLGDKALFEQHIGGKQVMIVTQKNIADFHLSHLWSSLSAYHCDVIYLPDGEAHKNMTSWCQILDYLVHKRHERSTTILALGGGFVGDLAGFAAACYLRGVAYIQIPTTLMAQVDSAIGGKTGFNYAAGKNLIGAFYHPACVIADLLTLETLSQRELISGLAEVIKYGLIRDALFFSWLENNITALIQGEQEALIYVLKRSVQIKGETIAQDGREILGIRSLLNFGHTLGHAIEAFFNYHDFLHGEAVAIGMYAAAGLSRERGWLTDQDYGRIQQLLLATHLPLKVGKKFNHDQLFSYLLRDKKMQDSQLKWVLLKGIGNAILTDQVSLQELRKIIA